MGATRFHTSAFPHQQYTLLLFYTISSPTKDIWEDDEYFDRILAMK
jgi:hypothetical protein